MCEGAGVGSAWGMGLDEVDSLCCLTSDSNSSIRRSRSLVSGEGERALNGDVQGQPKGRAGTSHWVPGSELNAPHRAHALQ